jgi:hypothetical protein
MKWIARSTSRLDQMHATIARQEWAGEVEPSIGNESISPACVHVPADRDHGFQAIVITHSRAS